MNDRDRDYRIARVNSLHVQIEDLAQEARKELDSISRERFIEDQVEELRERDELRESDDRQRAQDINTERRLLGL